ncbi:MAG TPA: hypothetical protein VI750_06700 [Pyrinomonadaceae bacterium]|nr:hypothetical protein [Pyrinomonadaceae bacterium]
MLARYDVLRQRHKQLLRHAQYWTPRGLQLTLRVPPSLAATPVFQEISPALRALYPSRGCGNGHQAG